MTAKLLCTFAEKCSKQWCCVLMRRVICELWAVDTMMHRPAPAQVPWVKAHPPVEPAPTTMAPVKPLGVGNMVLSVRILTDAVTNEVMNDLSRSHLY